MNVILSTLAGLNDFSYAIKASRSQVFPDFLHPYTSVR